jgi:hypothetical protein
MAATAAVRRPSATTSSRARWEPKSSSRSSSPSSPLTRSCSPCGRRSNVRQCQIDKEACPVFGRPAHLRQQNIARGLSPIMPKQYTPMRRIRHFYFRKRERPTSFPHSLAYLAGTPVHCTTESSSSGDAHDRWWSRAVRVVVGSSGARPVMVWGEAALRGDSSPVR